LLKFFQKNALLRIASPKGLVKIRYLLKNKWIFGNYKGESFLKGRIGRRFYKKGLNGVL